QVCSCMVGARKVMDATQQNRYCLDLSLVFSHSAWLWLFLCGLFAAQLPALGQVSVAGRGKDFVAPVTDAQGRKSVLRGKDVRPLARGVGEITGMQGQT